MPAQKLYPSSGPNSNPEVQTSVIRNELNFSWKTSTLALGRERQPEFPGDTRRHISTILPTLQAYGTLANKGMPTTLINGASQGKLSACFL